MFRRLCPDRVRAREALHLLCMGSLTMSSFYYVSPSLDRDYEKYGNSISLAKVRGRWMEVISAFSLVKSILINNYALLDSKPKECKAMGDNGGESDGRTVAVFQLAHTPALMRVAAAEAEADPFRWRWRRSNKQSSMDKGMDGVGLDCEVDLVHSVW